MSGADQKIVERVFNTLVDDDVLFVESPEGLKQNVQRHQAQDILMAWQSNGKLNLRLNYEHGTWREHLAASPTLWASVALLALTLVLAMIVALTGWGNSLLSNPSASFRDVASNGYFYGFVFAVLTILMMFAKLVVVVSFRDPATQERVTLGVAIPVAKSSMKSASFHDANSSDETARESFFRRSRVTLAGSYLNVRGRLVPKNTISEIKVATRLTGLWRLGACIAGAVVTYLILRVPENFPIPVTTFPPLLVGTALPVLIAVAILAFIALLACLYGTWHLVAFGGWAQEDFQVVIKTTRRKTLVVGDSDRLRAATISADVATLLDNDKTGEQA